MAEDAARRQPPSHRRIPLASVSRRHIQCALGALWLLDGALQLQPFMFGPGFAEEILAPSAEGQPSWVAAPVHFFAGLVATAPAAFNTMFAAIQILLGIGLLIPRTVRAALTASIAWAIGVWWLGEGLGGLASGHATLITGAPGAVALYALLAVAVWPASEVHPDASGHAPANWLPAAWAAVWIGGAFLQSLPPQHRPTNLAAQLAAGRAAAPGWLAAADRTAGHVLSAGGNALLLTLIALMAAVGIAALRPGPSRLTASTLGAALALVFWIVGQDLGELYTGRSTDPNTGPLLIILAISVASRARGRAPANGTSSAHPHPRRRSVRAPVHA
ncbi:MAG: hypothetical protein QOE97_2890 [Pseudonocardiales bacterium]|jgi:hypothetical protein|nr:hypothetical protein [Pseudonocardiales bacterium]